MAKVKKRGTSSAPIVLGVVSGVLGLPSAFCSGMCGAAVSAGNADVTGFYLFGPILLSLAILVFSCFTKKSPVPMGILILVLSLGNLILFGVTLNILGIIAAILSVLAGIISIVQKKEVVE